MPLWKSPSVGDEIDSRCSRCREETIHRVVAMLAGSVHLVICTRCNSQHRHRPSLRRAKPGTFLTERQAKVLLKYREAQTPKPKTPLAEWQAMKGSAGEVQPLAYEQTEAYLPGQAIHHALFGLGFVRKLVGPHKIEVVFAYQVKVLAMGRGVSED